MAGCFVGGKRREKSGEDPLLEVSGSSGGIVVAQEERHAGEAQCGNNDCQHDRQTGEYHSLCIGQEERRHSTKQAQSQKNRDRNFHLFQMFHR